MDIESSKPVKKKPENEFFKVFKDKVHQVRSKQIFKIDWNITGKYLISAD